MQNYLTHYKSTLRLGLPIAVGQVGVILVGFADTMMVGRYATLDLAAVAFANNMFNLVVIALLGFSYGITPLVGALFGKGDREGAGEMMRHAATANVIFALLLTAAMGIVYFFLDRFGQPEEVLPVVRPYYLTILASMVFVALFNALRQFTDSLMRTSVAMWILIGGNALNIVLNYIFIYGKLGFSPMGALGAGVATLISRIVMAVVFVALLFCSNDYEAYRRGFRRTRARVDSVWHVAKMSLPVALQMGMETGMFTLGAIFVGWLGTLQLASYQLMVTVSTLGYLFYYSIGAAIAIRVSLFTGRGEYADVRRATWAGYHILLLLAFVVSVLLISLKQPLIRLFTSDEQLIAISVALIVPMVVYQFGDATQVCFSNALRGLSAVMDVMAIAFVGYLVMGVPAALLFEYPAGLEEHGVFYGFAVGLMTAGLLFMRSFVKSAQSKPTDVDDVKNRTQG